MCFALSVATGAARPVSPDAVSMPAACLTSHIVGGVWTVKVNERSGWMVMLQGVGVPGTRPAVRAVRAYTSESACRRKAQRAREAHR